jgi:hypothetical protein
MSDLDGDPNATRTYLLKDALYTQVLPQHWVRDPFKWWATTWGYPGSQGCMGMRLDGSKFTWARADIGTPLVIRC